MPTPTIFDYKFRALFHQAVQESPADAPLNNAIADVPSTQALERYVLMSMPPSFQQWQGVRRPINLAPFGTKELPNVTYTAEVSLPKELAEDAQNSEFDRIPSNLGAEAANFRNDHLITHLNNAESLTWVDAQNEFVDRTAAVNGFGIGDNLVHEAAGDITIANSTADTSAVFLFTGGPLKPLLYQLRAGYPQFGTDFGTEEASKAREYMWWADLRVAKIGGLWYDKILVKMGGTPTLAEAATVFDLVVRRFKGFQLPKGRSSDTTRFPHGNTVFSASNLLCVASTGCFQAFDDIFSMDPDPGGLSTRLRRGKATVIQTGSFTHTN